MYSRHPADRDKKEITLAPHMWRFTLKCSVDDELKIKVTNDGCDVTECFDINGKGEIADLQSVPSTRGSGLS